MYDRFSDILRIHVIIGRYNFSLILITDVLFSYFIRSFIRTVDRNILLDVKLHGIAA